MQTGQIEVDLQNLWLLNPCRSRPPLLPFAKLDLVRPNQL